MGELNRAALSEDDYYFFDIFSDANDELLHYGMPRRSGRYPWGSGENPYQHTEDFLSRVQQYKDAGLTEKEIVEKMGIKSTTQFRTQYRYALDTHKALLRDTIKGLKKDGLTNAEVANKLGLAGESTVRSILNSEAEARTNTAKNTADFLRKEVDKKGYIDVGKGVERQLGISQEKLKEALYILDLEGYKTYGGRISQVTNPTQKTTLQVLTKPGTEHKEIFEAAKNNQIESVVDYISRDQGDTFVKRFRYPSSMDSKRLDIRYAEDGGTEKDGVIELRRGVEDLSLGNSHYAQVRILVEGTHYLKGMAVYSDDLPDGVDVRFNTNKKKGTPALGPKDNTVLKPIKNDPKDPFGSYIKEEGGQYEYIDSKTGEKKLGLINKRSDEGDWGEWSDHLPSQFLAKQSLALARKQLKMAEIDKEDQLKDIMELTNNTIKKDQLLSFAEGCDTAAVHLQAAALPRQGYQVILPVSSLKDNEVFAPNYRDGEQLALIRFPHGGTFEIPILTVNNKNKEGSSVITKQAKDAVGINKKVADRLSGADFDGDTVMVIPANDKVKIKSTNPLKGLEGFDPTLAYGGRDPATFKHLSKSATQTQMGVVSNLITDMTLKGANDEELAKAVRHSMVVIDADKHNLDYKASEKDNDIDALKKKYQSHIDPETGRTKQGASTLISLAKNETYTRKTKGSPKINPETGELEYQLDTRTITNKKGEEEFVTVKKARMAITKDARELSSGTDMENLYADYANKMKALANQARKEYLATPDMKYDPKAREIYAAEVASLNQKLTEAELNAPKERRAQLIASSELNEYKERLIKEDPGITKTEIKAALKKVSQKYLNEARVKVGAKRVPVYFTDKEWEAIQAGAITSTALRKLLLHADEDRYLELSSPRPKNTISETKINKIKTMANSDYTIEAIARATGVSVSTVRKYM